LPTNEQVKLLTTALYCAALPLCVIAGCRSGAQQDLVARELRMQEDKLYAMEDYLAQYQQLVCQYRTENASLRRQLESIDSSSEDLPARGTRQRARDVEAAPRETPTDESSLPPSQDTVPLPENTEVQELDVPPLNGSSSSKTPTRNQPLTANPLELARKDEPATGQAIIKQLVFVDQNGVNSHPPKNQPVPKVAIRGEVVANESGGGPRLAVEVSLPADSQRPTTFDGSLSLMLLAPEGDDEQRKLARWDFGPNDVRSATEEAGDAATIRFYLELPADTPLGQPTQIWVRLLPREGGKLLNHAEIDLQNPGQFASVSIQPPDGRQHETPEWSARSATTAAATAVTSPLLDSDWSIARPGEPANVAAADTETGYEWRASSEPIAQPTPPVPDPIEPTKTVQHAAHIDPAVSDVLPKYKRPTWTPDRSAAIAGTSSQPEGPYGRRSHRPAWSASR
jgi:hypothetical protein